MDKPVPAPREGKRPIPTPRKHIKKPILVEEDQVDDNSSNSSGTMFSNSGTFSKRVSNASKLIAGDLNQLVQDQKKAVIEGTRQSLRRITRKFSSASSIDQKTQLKRKNDTMNDQPVEESTIELFKNISFESPISRANSIYSNVEETNNISSESLNLPPPQHPPPPLPDESIYDAPSSSSPVASSTSSTKLTTDYEKVYPASNVSDSDLQSTADDNYNLSRSASWSFYDGTPSTQSNFDNVLVPRVVDETGSTSISETHVNSIYENHEVPFRTSKLERMKASKSVIMQFDPLNDETSTQFSEMNLLEELLQGDLYGNISETYTLEDWSASNDSDTEEYLNPPTPPLRFDSLPEEGEEEEEEVPIRAPKKIPQTNHVKKKSVEVKSRTSWFTDADIPAAQTETKKTLFKQVIDRVSIKQTKTNNIENRNVVERPILGSKNFSGKKGMLYKVQGGPVEDLFGEYSGRWCVFDTAAMYCYSDNTCAHLKEKFYGSNILSIQILQDAKYKYRYDNDDLHCFELNVTGKSRGGHIYGSKSISERRIWLQCLAEMLTQRFKTILTANFTRMGWSYVREGVSGRWIGAWIILSERELHFAIDNQPVKTIDLRKARCIVLQIYQESDKNPQTNDKGPNMLVDCPDLTLYLRMWTARETKVWCHIVKLEAHNCGAAIEQQQLTKNEIPVVVEKCIDFIYVFGSMSEGIYRKTGSLSTVSNLLAQFRKDAFAVQLIRDNYSEYEVASALKRFFRELPEPLLGCDHRQYLYEVAKHNVKDEKIRMFKAALDQLPPVAYNTARKLLSHLHFISNQRQKNLMTIENLAAIWGPTLMHYDDNDKPTTPNTDSHIRDAEVISQLIRYYRSVFPEDQDELEKEKRMLKVLKRHMQSPQGAVNHKNAGDLRVWIYMFNKDGKSFNIGLGPQRTAYDVCTELSEKMKTPVHELILEEVVLGDKLFRPIHHSEKVLDVVLKWSYWDETDRKDNYLTCCSLSKYWEYIREKPMPLSGELRFADPKAKVFKPLMFQFTQGVLSVFKDKTSDTSIYSWKIEDITWYLGHESKRAPQSRWTITLLVDGVHPNRSRTRPYFGNVIVWTDAAMRANWLSAMLKSRYPHNLTPPPRLVTI